MRKFHIASGLGIAAAAAAMLAIDAPIATSQPFRKRFDQDRPPEMTRKQIRAADRSKKQYLLKGIRP